MKPAIHHDAKLIRFAEVVQHGCTELGTKDAAYILNLSTTVVRRLCETGALLGSHVSASDRVELENKRRRAMWERNGRKGTLTLAQRQRGNQHTWTVNARSLLAYLLTSSTDREMMLEDIRELMPAWLTFARRIAGGMPLDQAEDKSREERTATAAASNIIKLREVQMDLFKTA